MFGFFDLFAVIVCALVWLGPMFGNGMNRKWHLLHPISFFPLMVLSTLASPLIYRIRGETVLKTARLWSDGQWFLAAPMLVLALSGIFYHAGVLLSGTALRLGPADDVRTVLSYPLLRNLSNTTLVVAASLVVSLGIVLQLARPNETYQLGFYWMHLFFRSFEVIPVLMFQQNRRIGQWFLLIVLPCTILVRSKAAFLTIPCTFLLLYQRRLFKMSKTLVASLVLLVLLTPLAVALYASDFSESYDRRDLDHVSAVSWDETFEALLHRDYSFETFACVYHWQQEGESWHWGGEFLRDLAQIVPAWFWIGEKQVQYFHFPKEYLPYDYRGWTLCYARHMLTTFALDLGIPGCCLGTLLFGFLFGSVYRVTRSAAARCREAWPLAFNLLLVLQARFFAENGLPGGITRFLGMAAGVLFFLGLCRLFPAGSALVTAPRETC